MVREETSQSFEAYFWQDIELDGKTVLDAGTGFGLTTSEIAKRIHQQKHKGKIISVDLDPQAFEDAQELLQAQGLLKYLTFVKADLSNMPEIESETIDVIISTRTLADINSTPCRLTRAIAEFHRVMKRESHIVLSDECPLHTASTKEEEVAVSRWQLVKSISHLTGRPHANEIQPEDLEFTMKLIGFKDCQWAVFKGEKISKQRIDHFVKRTTELTRKIAGPKLKTAFLERINQVKAMFDKQGGIFPLRYILHGRKHPHLQETGW